MYLLLISTTGDLCVLKDFLGNPVNPLWLRQRFPDPPLKANKGLGSVWGKLLGGEGWPGQSPGLVVGASSSGRFLTQGHMLKVLASMPDGCCYCFCKVFHAGLV